MPAVFVSYSRKDSAFVRRLHDSLVERSYDVWVDWEDIPPSAEWFEEIRTGVRNADAFVYVISPDSVSSEVCSRELQTAFEQNKRVVPVVFREPGAADVPERAAALNWVFLRDSDDYHQGVETLVSALETDLEHVRVHTRLGVQADRWQSSGHDGSQLLRGAELSAAEAWLVTGAGKAPEATQLQREYLLASRQAATRRQRTIISAVTVALAVAIVLAIVALVQRSTAIHERNVAYARQLDADAQANLTTDPELSVLLATRAARVQANPQTESALLQSLAASEVRARYTLPSASAAGDVLPSPDGSRLLLTGPADNGTAWARMYLPGSTRPLFSVPGPGSKGASGWAADGRRFVIGGGLPAVYDASTGRALFKIPTVALDAALSPNGSRVAIVDLHAAGHVYEVATGRQVATFHPRYRGGVTCFALSPDGRYAAQCDVRSFGSVTAAGGVSTIPTDVDIWSTRTGRLVRRVSAPQLVGSVNFSPDSGRFVYTTSASAPTRHGARLAASAAFEGAPGTLVYDVTGSGGPVITFSGAASAAAFAPSPSAQSLAYTTITDDIVHIYDFYSKRDYPLPGATAPVETLVWDRSGRYLAAAGDDGVVRVYDHTSPGEPIETLAGHSGRVRSLGFLAGAEYLASSSDDGTTRLWQGPTPIPLRQRLDAPFGDGGVPTSTFTPGGARLVVGGVGERFSPQGRILATTTLHTLGTFTAPPGQLLVGSVVSPSGPTIGALLAGASSRAGALAYTSVDTYDARTGAHLATLSPGGGHALLDGGLNYAGTMAVTLQTGGRAELWDARSGRLEHVLAGLDWPAQTLSFSRDDRLLAIGHTPILPAAPPSLTTGKPVVVQVWNTQSGRLVRTITGEDLDPQADGTKEFAPLRVAFSPDARVLAVSGAQQNVQLFSVDTGRQLRPPLSIAGLGGGSFAASLAFSPDGRYLAAGAVNGAYVWRVPSYQLLPVFDQVPPSAPEVSAATQVRVAFTQDSRELVTNGWSTLEVWNVPDHLKLFTTAPAAVSSAAVSSDGSRIATTSAGGGVSLYACTLCGGLPQLLRVAADRVTRSLTPAERSRYLTGG